MPIGPFRTYSQPVNLRDLEERFEAGAEVTPETLKERRLIRKLSVDVKVLGVGELSKALSVSAHGFSKTAKEKIEAAGGSVTWLRGEPAPRRKRRSARRPATVKSDVERNDDEGVTESDAES
jgi:large subunit ribosomal protein L15